MSELFRITGAVVWMGVAWFVACLVYVAVKSLWEERR